MIDLRAGIKIYGSDWFLKYGLEPDAAADLLADWGLSYVIAQSRFLPMPDSAVESAVTAEDAARYAQLDDRAFRDALRDRGIDYFGVLNIGFDPAFAAAHPDLLPIDQFGRREQKQDWYIGIPPDRKANQDQKIGLLEDAVRNLAPDGIHLGFMRWPGFWEIWLSDVRREDMPDYCYSPGTLRAFAEATGNTVPFDDPRAAAALIARSHRAAWRDWKCGVTVAAMGRIRKALLAIKPDLEFAINTLPFFREDFDDAVEEVFGQDVARLAEVVDVFEVMGYHQIMRQPATWPAAVATDIHLRGKRRSLCTIQAQPLYLEGMHAGRGRSPTLDADEFARCVDAVEASPVDGLCVFTFADFLALRETADGRRMIDRLRRFRR